MLRNLDSGSLRRMAASNGSNMPAGTIPRSVPPMKLPVSEPSAMMKANARLWSNTAKSLPSRLSAGEAYDHCW